MSDSSQDRTTSARGRQTVLAILGMHRSGTSLAADVVGRLGIKTGENLLQADEHNQNGYNEDIHVLRLHDALLVALERPWNTVKGTFPLPADWTKLQKFNETRDKLAAYLRSEFRRVGGSIWAVKDPRMSVLLPLWYELARELDFELVPILCVRSPDAVAVSLEKRDALPKDLGRLIWLQYNAAIVSHAASRIKAVIDYDSWFIDPDRNLSLLARVVGRDMSSAACSKIVGEAVSAQSRHHPAGTAAGIFQTWWLLLQQWAATQEIPSPLFQEAKAVYEFLDAFDPWRHAVTDQEYLAEMIDAREADRRRLVVVADGHLEAFRTTQTLFLEAKDAIARLEKERDETVAVATRHLEAFRTTHTLFLEAKDAIARLEREHDILSKRYHVMMQRFDRFPFSLMIPKVARAAAPTSEQGDK